MQPYFLCITFSGVALLHPLTFSFGSHDPKHFAGERVNKGGKPSTALGELRAVSRTTKRTAEKPYFAIDNLPTRENISVSPGVMRSRHDASLRRTALSLSQLTPRLHRQTGKPNCTCHVSDKDISGQIERPEF